MMALDLARRLVAAKIVAPEAMAGALQGALLRGVTVARALLDNGAISEQVLEAELEKHCGAPLGHIDVALDAVARLPSGMCRRLGAVPARGERGQSALDVVCIDPLDPHVAAEFQLHLGVPVRIRRATAEVVERAQLVVEGAAPASPSAANAPAPLLPTDDGAPHRSGTHAIALPRPAEPRPAEPAPVTTRSSEAPSAPSPVVAEPGAVGEALDALRASTGRDEIIERALACLSLVARRVGIFAVKSDGFRGYACTESLAPPVVFRSVVVPRDDASILSTSIAVGLYLGPIPLTVAHAALLSVIGSASNDVAVAAVDVGGRPALILLADELSDTLKGTRVLDGVARAAGEALGRSLRAGRPRSETWDFGPRPSEAAPPLRAATPLSPSAAPRPRSMTPSAPVVPVSPPRAATSPPLGRSPTPRARAMTPIPGPLPPDSDARKSTPLLPFGPGAPHPQPLGAAKAPAARTTPPADRTARQRAMTPAYSFAGLATLARQRSTKPPSAASEPPAAPPPRERTTPPRERTTPPAGTRPIARVWEPRRPGAPDAAPGSESTRRTTASMGVDVPEAGPAREHTRPPPSAPAPASPHVRTAPMGVEVPEEELSGARPPPAAPAPTPHVRTAPMGVEVSDAELSVARAGRAGPSAPPAERARTSTAAPAERARSTPAVSPSTAPRPAPRTTPPPMPSPPAPELGRARSAVPPAPAVPEAAPAVPEAAPSKPGALREEVPSSSSRLVRGEAAVARRAEPTPVELAHAVISAGQAEAPTRSEPTPSSVSATRPARFEVLGPLGVATTGELVVARDTHLGRNVAQKRLPAELAHVPELGARLRREARLLAQLDHPGLPPIYELEPGKDASTYSMKLVEGKPLTKLVDEARAELERDGAAGEERRRAARLEAFVRVCDAVGFAHGKRVVHRELEPAHVLVGRHHDVFVIGWDHCRALGEPEHAAGPAGIGPPGSRRPDDGALIGNPAFMAPEQADGRTDEVDARTDVYALGLLLQEIVSLRPPRAGADAEALLDAARRGEREPLRPPARGVAVPVALAAIVDKASAVRRQDRYASAASLADDVRAYLRGDPVSAHAETRLERAGRAVARRRSSAVVALGVLFALAAAGALALVAREAQHGEERRRRDDRTQAFLVAAAQQSQAIDAVFQRARAEVATLAVRVAEALEGAEPEAERAYRGGDFDDPTRAPPDLLPSRSYGASVSLEWPAFTIAPAARALPTTEPVNRLARLRGVFEDAVVAGSGLEPTLDRGELRRTILDQGTAVHRIRVTLANGVSVAYPGIGGARPDEDPRARAGYALAIGTRGVRWGEPFRDPVGRGLLVTGATPIVDAHGERQGVAGVEIALDGLRGSLLAPVGPYVLETYLVAPGGRVVLRVGEGAPAIAASTVDPAPAAARADEPAALEPLGVPELRAAVDARRAGASRAMVRGRSGLAAYFPLQAIGWSYVVVADAQALYGE
jgi:serine/threonine-protein kinase